MNNGLNINSNFNGEYVQLKVSDCLKHLEQRFLTKYNLTNYANSSKSTIFFGLYNIHEIQNVQLHNGSKAIMFGGTDIDLIKSNCKMLNKLKKLKINTFYAISLDIVKRLNELNIPCDYFNLNLVDYNIFKPLTNHKFKNKIFIYNGLMKGNENLYGQHLYLEIINIFTDCIFILSNEIKYDWEQMPQIYSECFIGLRLTEHDGNANTVQEMVAMQIPIIHNGEQGGINWKDLNDIINIIKKYKNI